LYEALEGKPSEFIVRARDVYGKDLSVCATGTFRAVVRSTELNSVEADDCHNIGNCTKCFSTTICMIHCEEGAYTFEYVVDHPGHIQIRIQAKNANNEWADIDNSPAHGHVGDGGILLPGFSWLGYVGIVVLCMGIAAVVVALLFSIALRHHKRVDRPMNDEQREMAALKELEQHLEKQSLLQRRGNHLDEGAGGSV
jgi:hypothetical protein